MSHADLGPRPAACVCRMHVAVCTATGGPALRGGVHYSGGPRAACAVQVRAKRLTSGLYKSMAVKYHPQSEERRREAMEADIEVGYHTDDLSTYGLLMYHHGRLVEAYKRLDLKSHSAVGVLVVVCLPCPRVLPRRQHV